MVAHGVTFLLTPADISMLSELRETKPQLRDLLRRVDESIRTTEAHADTIAKATEQYTSDEIEIDPYPPISEGDNGAWVQAWVWVETD